MTYAEISLQYCYDVLNDTLSNRLAGKYEKLACTRQLRDLKRQDDPSFPFYFDEAAGNRHCKFMSKLRHSKGKWRGQYFVLEPHQVFMHHTLFAWKKKSSGFRRFTKVYWLLPRKNGKSFSSAGIGLYCAFCDKEMGAEVYCAATTESQAQMVFSPAWQMVHMDEELKEAFGITLAGTVKNPTSIYRLEDMSRMEPIIGVPKDGSSPSLGIVDEYHEHKTSALYDSLDTGQGARDNPILLVITTAGVDTSAPCYELHLEAIKILEGSLEKENVFTIIFGMDPEDDWRDFSVWRKANPNYLVSINEDYLLGKYNDAMNNLSQRNVLLTKHVSLWQSSGQAWLDMQKFEACENSDLKLEDFYGKECYIGLDLASKIDVVALELLFEIEPVKFETCPRCGSNVNFQDGKYICLKAIGEDASCSWKRTTNKRTVCFSKFYLPEETVEKKENQHYQLWAKRGLLTATEGSRTDFHVIEEDLVQLSKQFIIKELVFDPKEASYLISNIQQWASFECVEFTQSPQLISEPCKELEAMVVDGAFLYDGNAMFKWMCGNVILKQSKSGGNVKHYFPTKTSVGNKIDGAVAAIMALARLMSQIDSGDSYNARAKAGEENVLRVI